MPAGAGTEDAGADAGAVLEFAVVEPRARSSCGTASGRNVAAQAVYAAVRAPPHAAQGAVAVGVRVVDRLALSPQAGRVIVGRLLLSHAAPPPKSKGGWSLLRVQASNFGRLESGPKVR